MHCYKINLRPEIRKEIFDFNNKINQIFLEHNPLPEDAAYWCVEETGNHTMWTQCRPGRLSGKNIIPVEKTNWKWFKDNVEGFEEFFIKFRLQNFFGSVINRNFETHRHASWNSKSYSSWTMPIINDHGEFNIVETVDYVDPRAKYNQETNNLFEELPDEIEVKIVEQNFTQPGEVYIFDGWKWHQYFTGPNPRSTMTWADGVETEEQALEFIKYIESL